MTGIMLHSARERFLEHRLRGEYTLFAGDLPDNLAEIAASMEDESQVTQPDDRNNASLSEGEVPGAQAQR